MDYKHITSFLDRFKNLISQGQRDYGAIVEIITKHISFPIDQKMIKIKGNIIYIQGSPMQKSEILIHKSGILSDLSNLIPERRFIDIR
jgi:hypothetical protein